MINNNSNSKTPIISKQWINKSESIRIESINILLKELKLDNDFIAINAKDNGFVIVRIKKKVMPASERGLALLELEEKLKSKIDNGITVWCESVGDRNTLRNLRGVKILV